MTGAIRCPHCKVPKAAVWLTAPPQSGCAREEKIAENGMCRSIYIDLLERALRRAVAPQCFNANGFVLPGRLIEALDAARSAIRTAAAINGPVIADTGPGTSGLLTPQPGEAPVSGPAPAWQPIETAPRDGTIVDLWGINHLHYAKRQERICNVHYGPVTDWMGHERNDWRHGRGEDFEPTHWMPLPAPPVEKEGAE